MGRDGKWFWELLPATQFQSTLPAWGETLQDLTEDQKAQDFNPLSPHGERRVTAWARYRLEISIHSPRMGRDWCRPHYSAGVNNFNPLSPHGERRQREVDLL